MKYVFIIVFFSIILSGCGNSSSGNNQGDQKLELGLILRDAFTQESNSFVQGENIEFFLVATNNSSNTITLNFIDTQQYDFYISSSTNTEIWRWSADKVFGDALTELVIQAGDSIEISEIWDQSLPGGGTIAIGSYSAAGSLLDQSQEVQFGFTIQ